MVAAFGLAAVLLHAVTLAVALPSVTLDQPARRSYNSSDCVGVNAIAPSCKSNETPARRDFYYVGGHYVNNSVGNLTYDQIYVEKLTPVTGVNQSKPIVFFHGGGEKLPRVSKTPI